MQVSFSKNLKDPEPRAAPPEPKSKVPTPKPKPQSSAFCLQRASLKHGPIVVRLIHLDSACEAFWLLMALLERCGLGPELWRV